MEWERVAVVHGAGGQGSGYVVSPGLVLTSAHVVGEAGGSVTVFRPGRGGQVSGVVTWSGTSGGRDDAALVAVDAATFDGVDGPVRWGRAATRRTGLACESWGAPGGVQRDGAPIEVRHIAGRLNPGDRLVGNRYTMSVEGHPYTTLPTGSPWSGMSGAAMFSGGVLIGVVAIDPAHAQHGELVAVPAYVLWHDERFRAALGIHAGRLVPVELDNLAEPVSRLCGPVSSPAALVLARREVVPWRERPDVMRGLHAWLEQPSGGVWLLHGPGGQGKTRLAGACQVVCVS
jgi:trypsin-like peptidase